MTRDEYLAWCKRRAMKYINVGDIRNGVTSMLSDMDKHPETKLDPNGVLVQLGMMAIIHNDLAEARRFIQGFN